MTKGACCSPYKCLILYCLMLVMCHNLYRTSFASDVISFLLKCFLTKVAENEKSISELRSEKADLQEKWDTLQQQVRNLEDKMVDINGHMRIKMKDLDRKLSLLKYSEELLASDSDSVE